MFSHPEANSLFTFSPKHLKVKRRKNGAYILKTKSQSSQPMTWFTDSPAQKTGKLPADYFGYHFNLLFSESKPNASLNFRSKKSESDAIFEMKNASVRRKGDVDIIDYKIKPIGKSSARTIDALIGKALKNPYLFIDDSTPSSGASADSIVAKAGAGTVGAVGVGFLAYRGYLKTRMLLQTKTQETITDLKSKIEDIFSENGESDLSSAYFQKMYQFTEKLSNFKPKYDNFDDFQEFLSQDEFSQNLMEAFQSELSDLDFSDPANLEEVLDALGDAARAAAQQAYFEAEEIYKNGGWEKVSELYQNAFNMTADEIASNPDVLANFDLVAKQINADALESAKQGVARINSEIADALGIDDSGPVIESVISNGISDGVVSNLSSELAAEALGTISEDIAPEVAEEMLEFLLVFA